MQKWELKAAGTDLRRVLEASSVSPQLICEDGKPLGVVIDVLLYEELMSLRSSEKRPTIAELLEELAAIQSKNPVELEISPRKDRYNPFIEE